MKSLLTRLACCSIIALPFSLFSADANGDGLDDHWQEYFQVSPFSGGSDPDNDGRPNIVESINWTDPDDSSHPDAGWGAVILTDDNDNLLDDRWEEQFTQNGVPIVPGADPDGDSRTNLEESIVGSNPWAADAPYAGIAENPGLASGPATFTLRFHSVPAQRYCLEKSDDLITWTEDRQLWGDGSTREEELQTQGATRQFYRIKLLLTNGGPLDTDGDGLNDWTEIFVLHTDPDSDDSDFDGFLDGQEMAQGLDPLQVDDLSPDGGGPPPGTNIAFAQRIASVSSYINDFGEEVWYASTNSQFQVAGSYASARVIAETLIQQEPFGPPISVSSITGPTKSAFWGSPTSAMITDVRLVNTGAVTLSPITITLPFFQNHRLQSNGPWQSVAYLVQPYTLMLEPEATESAYVSLRLANDYGTGGMGLEQWIMSVLTPDVFIITDDIKHTGYYKGLVEEPVGFRLFPGGDSAAAYPIPDSVVRWIQQPLHTNGNIGEEVELGTGWNYTLPVAEPGIWKVLARITLPNGNTTDIPFIRFKDALYGFDSAGDFNPVLRAGRTHFYGIASHYLQLKVLDDARAHLGSTAYAKKLQMDTVPDHPDNPANTGSPKCNIFVFHQLYKQLETRVPYYYRWSRSKFSWVVAAPAARQDWWDSPPENVPILNFVWTQRWVTSRPEPGDVVSSPSGGPVGSNSGHMGILDYDGSWINAGTNHVNRYPQISEKVSVYQPAHIRRLNQ